MTSFCTKQSDEPWSVALRPHRCSVAEFWCQPPVRARIQGGGVDPGRAPRGVGVCLAPACRNYRQLPANWGRVWLRLLTSLSGQKAAGGHLEVESDSKSDCWQKQCFILHSAAAAASGFYFTLLTSRCSISDQCPKTWTICKGRFKETLKGCSLFLHLIETQRFKD